jgi:hypothetical protein
MNPETCIKFLDDRRGLCQNKRFGESYFCHLHSTEKETQKQRKREEHENARVGEWLRKFEPNEFKRVIGFLVL